MSNNGKDIERTAKRELEKEERKEKTTSTKTVITKSIKNQLKVFIVVILIILLITGLRHTVIKSTYQTAVEIASAYLDGKSLFDLVEIDKENNCYHLKNVVEAYNEFKKKMEKGAVKINDLNITKTRFINMLKNALATQLPDLRPSSQWGTEVDYSGNAFQGKVHYYRKSVDGTQKAMEYVPSNEFKTMCARINTYTDEDAERITAQGNFNPENEEVISDYAKKIFTYFKQRGWSNYAATAATAVIWEISKYSSILASDKTLSQFDNINSAEFTREVDYDIIKKSSFISKTKGYGLFQFSGEAYNRKLYEATGNAKVSIGDWREQLRIFAEDIDEKAKNNENLKLFLEGKYLSPTTNIRNEEEAVRLFKEFCIKGNLNYNGNKDEKIDEKTLDAARKIYDSYRDSTQTSSITRTTEVASRAEENRETDNENSTIELIRSDVPVDYGIPVSEVINVQPGYEENEKDRIKNEKAAKVVISDDSFYYPIIGVKIDDKDYTTYACEDIFLSVTYIIKDGKVVEAYNRDTLEKVDINIGIAATGIFTEEMIKRPVTKFDYDNSDILQDDYLTYEDFLSNKKKSKGNTSTSKKTDASTDTNSNSTGITDSNSNSTEKTKVQGMISGNEVYSTYVCDNDDLRLIIKGNKVIDAYNKKDNSQALFYLSMTVPYDTIKENDTTFIGIGRRS